MSSMESLFCTAFFHSNLFQAVKSGFSFSTSSNSILPCQLPISDGPLTDISIIPKEHVVENIL